ncbi:MAG: hypothetical protein ACOYLI_07225 [Synechococcus lacustris]
MHRPIREALPFLLVLVFTLAPWILLLFCTAAAVAQREIAMRRECNALAMMLSLNFVADLINVNTQFLQSRIPGTILFMQVGLLLAAMLALFTFLYWVLDPPRPTMERQAFWWVPPPGNTILDSPWRPAFIDYLYLSTVVTFSFFPTVVVAHPRAGEGSQDSEFLQSHLQRRSTQSLRGSLRLVHCRYRHARSAAVCDGG